MIENSLVIFLDDRKQLLVLCVYSVNCVSLFQSQEELQEYCRHHEITYVALVSDKEGSHVKVKAPGNVSNLSGEIPCRIIPGGTRLAWRPCVGMEVIPSVLLLKAYIKLFRLPFSFSFIVVV